MPIIRLPSEHDTSYPPARGPVLLLTCMDLRLMDNIIQFMDHDGLANRYDHVILAGASLGALGGPGVKDCLGHTTDFRHWKSTFKDHLEIAWKLHHIKDVYLLEHRDCGAYREFLGKEGDFDDDQYDEEEECHHHYASLLADQIECWANEMGAKLRIKAFLMDLRGNAKLMFPEPGKAKETKKKSGKRKS